MNSKIFENTKPIVERARYYAIIKNFPGVFRVTGPAPKWYKPYLEPVGESSEVKEKLAEMKPSLVPEIEIPPRIRPRDVTQIFRVTGPVPDWYTPQLIPRDEVKKPCTEK